MDVIPDNKVPRRWWNVSITMEGDRMLTIAQGTDQRGLVAVIDALSKPEVDCVYKCITVTLGQSAPS
jgi:hypothetical protein